MSNVSIRASNPRGSIPPFWINFSISGAYLTFVGLWAAPFLVHAHGMSAVAASRYTGLTLLGFACCVPAVGWLSDRVGVRRPIVLGGAVAFTLTGLVWVALPAHSPGAAAAAALATGLVAPCFTLSWAIAKEVNPPERAGMAIAVSNIGGFLASGILQPLVGWVVDHGAGVVAGGSADSYRLGIGVLAAWSVIGIVAATRLTETRCRNVWSEGEAARR